jgi:hypothetical protein
LSEGAAPECVAFAPADCASNCKFHLCDVSLTFLEGTGQNWAGIQITKKTLERRGDALAKKLFALKCRPLTTTLHAYFGIDTVMSNCFMMFLMCNAGLSRIGRVLKSATSKQYWMYAGS